MKHAEYGKKMEFQNQIRQIKFERIKLFSLSDCDNLEGKNTLD